MLRPLGRALMGPNRRRGFKAVGKQPTAKSIVEPSRRSAVKLAQEKGIALPVTQATGRNKLLGFFQRMSDTVFGDPRAVLNAKAIAKWGKELTGKDIGGNVSQQAFGEGLGAKFAGEAKRLAASKKMLENSFRKKLSSVGQMLRGNKAKPDPELGTKIRETISTAHDDFMESSSLLYAQPIMRVGGGINAKIFSSQAIKAVAKGKLSTMMKTQTGDKFSVATNEVVSKLKKFSELEDTVSFEQLTALRKDLGKSAYTGNLHSDVASHDAMDFLRAIDDTIDNFAVVPRDAKTGRIVRSDWKDVIKGFREANKQYSKGIQPFKDTLVKTVSKDLTERGAVQPSMIVDAMAGAPKENVGQLMGILERSNPKLAKHVRGQFFDDIIWNKTLVGKTINPGQLSKNIERLKPGVLERVYGGEAKQIRKLAQQLDEFGHGKLDIDEAIDEGGVAQMMGKLLQKTKQEEQFLKGRFAQIAQQGKNVGGSEYGKVVDLAMKDAGYAKELIAMSTPQQMQQAQNIAMQKLLNKLVDNSSPIATVLKEDALQKTLANMGAFTSKGGDNALKILLGPGKFKEITELAKVASLSVTHGNSGLVAMSIALNPVAHLGRLAELNVMASLLMKPGFINWMVKGWKSRAWRQGGDASIRSAAQFIATQIQQVSSDLSFDEEVKQLQAQQK